MIDIRLLRDDPETAARALARRGVSSETMARIVELDARRRTLITEGDALRATQNTVGKQVGSADSAEERTSLIAQVRDASARLESVGAEQAAVDAEFDELMATLPNLPHPDAPDGDDDRDAVKLFMFGQKPAFDHPVRDHVEIGEALGIIDIPRGVKIAGSRNAILLGQAVLLEFALLRYVLGVVAEHGFTPVLPPVTSRAESLFGTGFLPGSRDQIYEIGEDDLFLVGTSEVPLAGMHADEIFPADDLPVRYAGFSTNFRREAGTYGKDTRGIFRVHQFDKVEMFVFTTPDRSWDEHVRLRDIEVEILTSLGLHGRVVDIPVGDLGDSAARKYDCEVWLPGQDAYRELTSCSNTTDFQARRLKIRYRDDAEAPTQLVHTLNGTACAVGRTLIALLETHQRADGSVAVPEVLQPHLGTDLIS